MPLHIPGAGELVPFLRYQASVNAWQISQEGTQTAQEIQFTFPAAFDLQNLQLGWLLLGEGVREWRPWPNNSDPGKPADGREWKVGFECDVYSKNFGAEPVRQMASSATGSTMFIQELYNTAEQAPEWGQGMAPVVQITGSRAMKVGKGTTRVPEFKIIKWVQRPAELGPHTLFRGAGATAPTPAPVAAPVAPPPPPPAPAPVAPPPAVGGDEF